MAYNNANMLRIAQIGAMTRPQFRNMPTLDLGGAVDNFMNARDKSLEAARRQAYVDELTAQHPEDAAKIAANPDAYAKMINDNAAAERDQQFKMDMIDKQFNNSIVLQDRQHKLLGDIVSGASGVAPDGTPLTGNKAYDDAYMKEVGKKTAQVKQAEADANEMKPALIQAMARADKAARSGNGVGFIGGTAADFGLNPLPNAGANYADIQSANTQMNTYLRKQLAATGLTGSELNSAVEAEAYRYQIKPTDSESVIRRKLQNFAQDKLGGTAFDMNTGQAVNQAASVDYKNKYGLE